MKTEELFSLALRIIGLLAFLYGLAYLLDALLFSLGYFSILDSSPRYYVAIGIAHALVGLYLMRGAPLLLSFAFPATDVEENEDENNKSDSSN